MQILLHSEFNREREFEHLLGRLGRSTRPSSSSASATVRFCRLSASASPDWSTS
jgi:hypothetical protein